MSIDLEMRLAAAFADPKESDRALLREAACALRVERLAAEKSADMHNAWHVLEVGRAARGGYLAGTKAGFADGVDVALNPQRLDHEATRDAWRRQRATDKAPVLMRKAAAEYAHASDCATHNAPASAPGPCDCHQS